LVLEEVFNDSHEFEKTSIASDEFRLRNASNFSSVPVDWISYSPAGSVAPMTMKLKGTVTFMWTIWALAAAVISSGRASAITNSFWVTTFLLLGLLAQLIEVLMDSPVTEQSLHARPAKPSKFCDISNIKIVKTHHQREA